MLIIYCAEPGSPNHFGEPDSKENSLVFPKWVSTALTMKRAGRISPAIQHGMTLRCHTLARPCRVCAEPVQLQRHTARARREGWRTCAAVPGIHHFLQSAPYATSLYAREVS